MALDTAFRFGGIPREANPVPPGRKARTDEEPDEHQPRGRGVDFKRVQAHYDLSDEFFALFLDPSMTYSCAKFDTPETTLAEAQRAKIDLSLGKCELQAGHAAARHRLRLGRDGHAGGRAVRRAA